MMSAVARTTIAFFLTFAVIAQAFAQDSTAPTAGLELSGGSVRLKVTSATLAALPRIEQSVTFQTSKGRLQARFEGVLVWELMKSAGVFKEAGNHPELQQTFVVTGRDGYAIAFSMGEISPEFGNKAIMVAERADGQPLSPQDGLRLIVPGDNRGARSVRDVAKIEVR